VFAVLDIADRSQTSQNAAFSKCSATFRIIIGSIKWNGKEEPAESLKFAKNGSDSAALEERTAAERFVIRENCEVAPPNRLVKITASHHQELRMSTVASTELQEFAQFVQAKLTAGETKLSPEEVVDQWRDAHPTEEEFEENVQAIEESLAEMDAGARGKSVEQLRKEFEEFRRNRDAQP
jgi:hypothetical protein